jgi:hypothetical protein
MVFSRILLLRRVAAVCGFNSAFFDLTHPRPCTYYYYSLAHKRSIGLRLGNIVPDFSAETTQGKWESFHEWKKGQWAVRMDICRSFVGRSLVSYVKLRATIHHNSLTLARTLI